MHRPAGLALLFLLASPPAHAVEPPAQSPFASWAADVASPSAQAAARFLGRVVRRTRGPEVLLDRSHVLHASLDQSGPFVAADRAHAAGRTGRGVVIGIIDSGVDFAHAAFRDAAGRSRILWYLDMTLPAREGTAELDDRGFALFDGTDLALALRNEAAPRPSPDTSGHGTRVAAVAAGGMSPYLGIAPEADLIVVRADRLPGGRYDEADVADAVQFVFEAADRLGRSCVVNLSLGGQLGAHDGSSWLEQALDAAVNQGPGGRAVVVAAGNDAASAVHAVVDPRSDAWSSFDLLVPVHHPLAADAPALVIVDLWSAPGSTFAATLQLPDGTALQTSREHPSAEQPLAGGAAVRLETRAPLHADDRQEALVAFTGGDDGTVPVGRYAVAVTGDGPVDAWLSAEAVSGLLPFRLEGDVRREGTLAIPATARGAIAVGSVVVRTSWLNHLGQLLTDPAAVAFAPSGFSAWGPTADGRFKPDLLAPGEWIIAAQSADAALPLGPGGLPATGGDEHWAAGRGTSLAAPHVAGAAALVLQAEPWLHGPEVLDRLRATTVTDEPWRVDRGFGLLDAEQALRDPPPPAFDARILLSVARPQVTGRVACTTEVAVAVRGTDGAPRSAASVDFVLPRSLSRLESSGRAVRILLAEASRLAPGDCARLTVHAPGMNVSAVAAVCLALSAEASGCAMAASRGSTRGGWLAVAAVLLAIGMLRRPRPFRRTTAPDVAGAEAGHRRWPFLVVSFLAHALLLAPLIFLLPLPGSSWQKAVVAVSLLEPVPHVTASALPAPPSPPIELSQPVTSPPSPPLVVATPETRPGPRPRTRRPTQAAVPVPAAPAAASDPAAAGPEIAAATGVLTSLAVPLLGAAEGPAPTGSDTPPAGGSPGPATPVATSADSPPVDVCTAGAAQLRSAVDAQTRYPPLARRRRVTGTTVVSFDLASGGELRSSTVSRSSDSALLDEAALEAVRRAAPFAIGGCRYELPINFTLEP